MTYPYKDWPEPCRNLLMIAVITTLIAGLIYFFYLQPKWKFLQETREEFARTENRLKETPWPRNSERLRSLLQTYQKTLGMDRKAGLQQFSRETLRRATGNFNDKINDQYGTATLFISKASQIEYKDQYDRMNSTLQARNIFLDQTVLGMDETTVEPEKYKMLLKVWTVEKLTQMVLARNLQILHETIPASDSQKSKSAAQITVLPERSYFLDEKDKAPFLLEFPVRMTVRCSMEDFLAFMGDLQTDSTFLPMVQMEMRTDTSGTANSPDKDGNLALTGLQITFVCASFYRPDEETRKNTPRHPLPPLPAGA